MRTWIQEHRDTGLHKYSDTGKHGYRDTSDTSHTARNTIYSEKQEYRVTRI